MNACFSVSLKKLTKVEIKSSSLTSETDIGTHDEIVHVETQSSDRIYRATAANPSLLSMATLFPRQTYNFTESPQNRKSLSRRLTTRSPYREICLADSREGLLSRPMNTLSEQEC